MKSFSKLISLFFPVLAMLAACSSSTKGPHANPNAVVPSVEATQVRFGSLPLEERLSGTVIAENQVDVYAEINGIVEQVAVHNGDRVSRGQVLVRLRDTELREQLKQAEAGLEIAKARAEQAAASVNQLESQFNRAKTLADRNLSSEAELENITAQLTSAKANLSLAAAQVNQAQSVVDEQNMNLSRTVIRSPVEGLVGQRSVEPGQLVGNSSRMFIVGNPGNVRINMVLTERMMGYVREGMVAQITSVSFPDSVLRATVSRISPFLDPVTHTTTADIEIRNTGRFLIPGMFVNVDVFYGESQSATLVPNSALYRHPITGLEGVYVAKSIGSEVQPINNVDAESPPQLTEPTPVEFVEIKVLAKGRHMSGISGVSNGAWVVTVGQNLLAGGAAQARVRTVAWERIMDLQNLTDEGLLESVLNAASSRPASPAANRSM